MNYISGLGNISAILLTRPLLSEYQCSFTPLGFVFSFPTTRAIEHTFGVYGMRGLKFSLFFRSRAELKEFVDFFKERYGEFKKFWVLSWINEFKLTRTISSASAYIKNIGFTLRDDGNIRVFMSMRNGDIIVRKVIQSEHISDSEELIVFDSNVPYTIKQEDVNVFGRVLLVRFDGMLDVKIQNADGEELHATTTVNVLELPYEYGG